MKRKAERERQRLAGLARERREAHSKLIAELERQVGAWYRARLLRSYIRAAKRATGPRPVQAKLQQQSLDFLEWASRCADQLDPLSPVPRNPDQTPQRSLYGEEEAALKGTLLRLFPSDSHLARKLAFEMTAASTAERDEHEENEDEDEARGNTQMIWTEGSPRAMLSSDQRISVLCVDQRNSVRWSQGF